MSELGDKKKTEEGDIDGAEESSEAAESGADSPLSSPVNNQRETLGALKLIPFVDGPLSPLKSNEDVPPAKVGDGRERLVAEKIEDHKANRALRNRYAGKAYNLACAGLIFWGLAVSGSGIAHSATGRSMLSDSVLIAITTGATINVLAAFLGVIRGLFPASGKKETESRKEES